MGSRVTEEDLLVVLDSEVSTRTLVAHQLESYNSFLSSGLKQIVTQIFQVEKSVINERSGTAEEAAIDNYHLLVRFTDVKVNKPEKMLPSSGRMEPLYPQKARLNNLNYSGQIFLNVAITIKAFFKDKRPPLVRTEEIKNFQASRMPIMVGSIKCHLQRLPPANRKAVQEDPRDPGGPFILGGNEWALDTLETRAFNLPHVFHNIGHEKEICRLEILCKPGDGYENSSEVRMIYLTTGSIYLIFRSCPSLNYKIPFYLIFRLLGMKTEKEIMDNIVYGYSTPEKPDVVSDHMVQTITRAFHVADPVFKESFQVRNHEELIHYMSQQLSALNNKNNYLHREENSQYTIKRLTKQLLGLLDRYLFPHIGLTTGARLAKARYLGHLINKMLLVELEIIVQTDRDTLSNKRANAAGRSLAKSFKQIFNSTIVQPIQVAFTNAFKRSSFNTIRLAQTFKQAVQNQELEKNLSNAITAGNKDIMVKDQQKQNRLASEIVNRKNQLNYISTLRVVRTPQSGAQRQDRRADETRRVHSSYEGYICCIQSADTGPGVGTVKQFAMGASLTDYSDSEHMKEILLRDPEIVPFEETLPQHYYHGLAKVFVNGGWTGATRQTPHLVRKYRELRRQDPAPFHRHTSIVWDTRANEIYFWTDAGRFIKPLLVVRNNGELDELGRAHFGHAYDPFLNPPYPEPGHFQQDILVTKEDIRALLKKEITIEHLVRAGKIDYISPDELEGCHVACQIDKVYRNAHNPLKVYTHCAIPVSLVGLPALTCPCTQNNQPPRIIFQTNQAKQTGGWYCLSWPYRIDKHVFFQFYTEHPNIKTLANRYMYPNGKNAIVAIMCYSGYNQEDSLIVSETAAQRGFFKNLHYNFIKVDIGKDETVRNPDEATTAGINRHANYEHLRHGRIYKGAMVKHDDILVGKVMEIPRTAHGKVYKDTSVSYTYDEPGYIERVENGDNQNDESFIKIKFSNIRQLGIGCKFSSRHGQKGMTSHAFTHANLPFTASGLVPSIILNPCAIPSRMTNGQIIEGLMAKLAVLQGRQMDATIFHRVDTTTIGADLEKYGFHRAGTEIMYNGMSGEAIDVEIFIAPTYYQRLQKNDVEDWYVINTGPTCIITRQPLEGKQNRGGIRQGEMEKDVMISHGSGLFVMEKFREDSDLFDVYVCRNCGKFAIVNEKINLSICNVCRKAGVDPEIYKVKTTWASKLLMQELESSGVGVFLQIEPHKQEIYE